jgi:hypothetical protein
MTDKVRELITICQNKKRPLRAALAGLVAHGSGNHTERQNSFARNQSWQKGDLSGANVSTHSLSAKK